MTEADRLAQWASRVSYNQETGEFLWKDGSGPAGHCHSKGYLSMGGGSEKVLAHRLAWFIANGEVPGGDIDHINRVKTDNRIVNLRVVSKSANQANRGPQSNNTSGVVGVALTRQKDKWQAYIRWMGKRTHLGVFAVFEDAVAAREEAEARLFGDARGC